MIIQSDKIKKGGLCYTKEGFSKDVNYPLRIWKYKDGFNFNTGIGKYLSPVRNFGGEKRGDLLKGNVPIGERNYYLVIDSVSQTFDTRTVTFSFLCYIDNFIDRFIDGFKGDSAECFDKIYNMTKDIDIATDGSINIAKKNIGEYIRNM